MKHLSIIIPVFNVEKYIYECLESVFRQGLNEDFFEVIIINDGTEDHSMEMIADIISQHDNITVINQENQGISVARNNGMVIAKGEYILMLDSDDLLIDNSLKPILEKALSTQVDMIVTDFLQMNDEEIAAIKGHHPVLLESFSEIITGYDLLDSELCHYYWRNLYRREFLISNKISFIPGIFSQDVPFINECFLKAKKCLRSFGKFIIYRHGHASVSSSLFLTKRAKSMCISWAKVWELTKMEGLSPEIRRKQEDIAFDLFRILIESMSIGHLNKSEMFEFVDFLKKIAPDLYFHNGSKQQLLSFMFNRSPHSFIYICYLIQMARRSIRIFRKKLVLHVN